MNLAETVEWFRARGEPDDMSVYLAIGIRCMILAEDRARAYEAARVSERVGGGSQESQP